MKSRLLLLLFPLLMLSHPPAFAHEQEEAEHGGIEVTVSRMQQDEQAFFEVQASGFVRRTQKKAWQVLTDYDRLHAFVPNLLSSRVLERNDAQAVIEMNGRVGFFIMTRTIHLVVMAAERPFSAIDITLIDGDMKHYATHWELAPLTRNGASGTRINYSAQLEPVFFVPPLFGAALLRADVKQMLEAVITEIGKAP